LVAHIKSVIIDVISLLIRPRLQSIYMHVHLKRLKQSSFSCSQSMCSFAIWGLRCCVISFFNLNHITLLVTKSNHHNNNTREQVACQQALRRVTTFAEKDLLRNSLRRNHKTAELNQN
jgi:hypothetical protein